MFKVVAVPPAAGVRAPARVQVQAPRGAARGASRGVRVLGDGADGHTAPRGGPWQWLWEGQPDPDPATTTTSTSTSATTGAATGIASGAEAEDTDEYAALEEDFVSEGGAGAGRPLAWAPVGLVDMLNAGGAVERLLPAQAALAAARALGGGGGARRGGRRAAGAAVRAAPGARFGAYCSRRPAAVVVDGVAVPFEYQDLSRCGAEPYF